MLKSIRLTNVGPAPTMSMALAPRLNLITGDNGLGKTILLDCAWWALTQTWPLTWGGKGVIPDKKVALIEATVYQIRDRWSCGSTLHDNPTIGTYDFANSTWSKPANWPDLGKCYALVIYLRVDGGISVCDLLRGGPIQFQESDIWEGKASVCEGLIRDIVRWAETDNDEFKSLAEIVKCLAGDEQFRLTNKVRRVFTDDARDYPFIEGPTGEAFPAIHAPAGLRRILGLAYLIVWAWREHCINATLMKVQPSTSLVLLIDEVESHLHPKWQRTLLPNLLRALAKDAHLQVIATTHSPLVLASIEPSFDVEKDKLFLLDIDKDRVVNLRETPWAKQGDVINWLVSDTFGLRQARSVEAERAIEAAEAWMRGDTASLPPGLATQDAIHAELQRVLAGHDPFWPRWVVHYEKTGGRP